jgi:hypothetical protein
VACPTRLRVRAAKRPWRRALVAFRRGPQGEAVTLRRSLVPGANPSCPQEEPEAKGLRPRLVPAARSPRVALRVQSAVQRDLPALPRVEVSATATPAFTSSAAEAALDMMRAGRVAPGLSAPRRPDATLRESCLPGGPPLQPCWLPAFRRGPVGARPRGSSALARPKESQVRGAPKRQPVLPAAAAWGSSRLEREGDVRVAQVDRWWIQAVEQLMAEPRLPPEPGAHRPWVVVALERLGQLVRPFWSSVETESWTSWSTVTTATPCRAMAALPIVE